MSTLLKETLVKYFTKKIELSLIVNIDKFCM